MKKTFIHHSGALGDLLLSLPCIDAIKRDSDFIHLAGRADVVEFLKKIGYIDGISDVDSGLYLPLFTKGSDEELKDFLCGFDSAYLFTTNERSVLSENLKAILPRTGIIRTIPPEGVRMHVSDYRMSQLKENIGSETPTPLLTLPSFFIKKARKMLLGAGYDFRRPLIAIHPGSGSKKKCWPLENYERLIRKISEDGNNFFVLFSGPAETGELKNALEDLASNLPGSCLHVPDSDLPIIASLASFCSLYIGNDSGITHLVSSFGKKVIALFGPTDPALWRPLGESRIISSVKECSPCEMIISGNPSRFKECAPACLSDISVERVIDEIILSLTFV